MGADEHAHLIDALAAIDPAQLSYQEWVDCGMALHESGYSWRDWDEWSRRDPRRYHEGECEKKWQGFGGGSERVTSGTIIHMAEQRGWRQPSYGGGQVFDWDDVGVTAGPDATEAASIPVVDVDDGSEWDPAQMLLDYLGVLFEDDEVVGYVCDAWQRKDDDKWLPSKGSYTRTAGAIRRELEGYRRNHGSMEALKMAMGEWEEEAGAWIRFNPLDGEGVDNRNVTRYTYALIESDVLELDRQLPAIKELNLPCAAVVSSAGKSVHAIVHVDATNLDEYRSRVKWLYDYCDRHGFVTDKQNKNCSRLSRMPGATRNGRRQLLLATNIGAESWEEWRKWAEESEDDLPDAECDDWDRPIELKPMLIGQTDKDCILRQGAKMIVVGDSKMGKSYTLIDLAEAIAVGGEWLGMRCAAGPVFYVNLEIDPEEFRWRQHKVWDARPESADDGMVGVVSHNFVRWNLRGYATNMEQLAPKLVRRVLSYGPAGTFQAIVIDPIYKVNGGDDNNASEVSKFTNMLDLIVMRCGCSIIYAHHHPKGATGGRKSIDRMAGSGVYGRDADTVMDFSPLFVKDELWESFDRKPAYRATLDCRSFKGRAPIDCIFDWPRFHRDADGKLKGCKVLGEDPRYEGSTKGGEGNKDKIAEEWERKRNAIDDAYDKYPKELDRSKDCARDVSELSEMINWGAFGLEAPKIETFRGWFGKRGKLAKYYTIGDIKTDMGTFKDSLIRLPRDNQ